MMAIATNLFRSMEHGNEEDFHRKFSLARKKIMVLYTVTTMAKVRMYWPCAKEGRQPVEEVKGNRKMFEWTVLLIRYRII